MYGDDLKLVTRMKAGEQRAFDEFFNTNAQRLAAFAARRSNLDASSLEDVVQNSLIKAVRNLAGYRGEAALFTWLAEICRHELADVHRKRARRPEHESLDTTVHRSHTAMPLRVPEFEEPPAVVDAARHAEAVIATLNALPERYALALEAKYGDGLSVEEIASRFGTTTVAAQSLLARAREAFRELWRDRGRDAGVRKVAR